MTAFFVNLSHFWLSHKPRLSVNFTNLAIIKLLKQLVYE